MMRAAILSLPVAAMLCMAGAPALAQDNAAATRPAVKPAVLRGTLGNDRVQVNLRPKKDEGGVEGDYFIFGRGARNVLLAGEFDGKDVFLEESENGTDVSGHWDGTVSDDTISGTWQSVDGSLIKPFTLQPVPAR